MSDSIERALCASYAAMAQQFAIALGWLEKLRQTIENDEDCTSVLEQLSVVFARVAHIESSVVEPRNQLSKSRGSVSRELAEALTRLETFVTETRSRVQSAEAAILAKMEGLSPVLEIAQRGQQMHSAYRLSFADCDPTNQSSCEC